MNVHRCFYCRARIDLGDKCTACLMLERESLRASLIKQLVRPEVSQAKTTTASVMEARGKSEPDNGNRQPMPATGFDSPAVTTFVAPPAPDPSPSFDSGGGGDFGGGGASGDF